MVSRFLLKLRHGAELCEADEAILAGLTRTSRTFAARRDFAIQGREASLLPVILEGWACRHRLLENGKRQITALYLPGDICEPFGALPRAMDSSVSALTQVTVAHVSPAAFRAAARASSPIEEALWWDLLMTSSIDQERLVSLGRRSAAERLGHLFCELHLRLTMVGLAETGKYELLITQAEMSDLLGLTPVHVSRSLRTLRESELITLQGRRLTIHDLEQLRAFSYFDPSYLKAPVAKYTEPTCRVFATPR